jgi:hypothetical protein
MLVRKRREPSSEQSTRITDQVPFVYQVELLLDITSTCTVLTVYFC